MTLGHNEHESVYPAATAVVSVGLGIPSVAERTVAGPAVEVVGRPIASEDAAPDDLGRIPTAKPRRLDVKGREVRCRLELHGRAAVPALNGVMG